jgi:hypothetical protein
LGTIEGVAPVKRVFWFAAGAVSGVYGMVKVKRTLEVFTPDGLGARIAAARAGVRMFADEVTAGMHEREEDLLAELRAHESGTPELDPVAPETIARLTNNIPHQMTREGSTDGHR